MRKRIAGMLLVGGILVGTGLALYTWAEEKPGGNLKKDWSKLQVVTYPSGLTGFFDPAAGRLYVYDANVENCIAIRELTELGEPTKKLKR